MDISTTTEPRSDQQNYDDYVTGPKTVTVTEVRAGNAEQPVEIHLAEFPGRPYKPSKSMRRVLVAAWGKDSKVYAGRSMTLYGDPTVKFGGETVGGIKISHLSHIEKPVKIALTVTRGKRAPHVVKPLEAAPQASPEPTAEQVAASTDTNELRDMWQRSGPERRAQIQARVAELNAQPEPQPDDDGTWQQTGPDLLDGSELAGEEAQA